jgi:hypothetical protein
MEWLDVHAGSVQAFATLVLVIITAYYAWVSRAQVKEMRATLQSSARMTLQGRLDRVSELMLEHPDEFAGLDDPDATGNEQDGRFHLANILVAALEEAYIQHHIERSMPAEDWRAWDATIQSLMQRPYLARYWANVRGSFSASFARYLDERVADSRASERSR